MEKKEIDKKTQLQLNFDSIDICPSNSNSMQSDIQQPSKNSIKIVQFDYRKEIYKRILKR